MSLAEFLTTASKQIVAEWAEFARTCVPAATEMDLEQRRDHIEGMLRAIAVDLGTTQTKTQQSAKSKGIDDGHAGGDTAANAHGTDRAAIGFTPAQMISEFRALRASVLRLWGESGSTFGRADLQQIMPFNEAIDKLLAESVAQYTQDIDRSKDLFLGILGHDLRNPLGAIMMSATVMMTQEGPEWPHAKTAARILRSGTRMDGIIRDLLDFTRSGLGTGIPIVRAEVDLASICRQAVDEILAFHPSARVTFEASGELVGRWDGGRIAQALSNLLGNAQQHGLANAPIEVALRGEAQSVVLTVHNEGRPIAQNQLRAIFEPFRQLDAKQGASPRSVGLGLYIARAIVTAHQGTIDVDSSARGGTTFTVRLPRDAGTTAAPRG